MSDLVIVVGTRPEIIKMAPIINSLEKSHHDFEFVHTGQHYDFSLSRILFKDLNLREPDHRFQLSNTSPTSQIGEIMVALEKKMNEKSKIMLIQGDTNSMLAAALTGVKLKMKLGHVESGLRSYDWRMPEEHNRRMVDHVSDLLFAPTITAKKNLLDEHVHGKIYVTGNTVIDTLMQHFQNAQKNSKILNNVAYDEFGLATIHRSENVDNPNVLKNLVEAFMKSPIPLIIPLHPRTLNKLRRYRLLNKLKHSGIIQLLPPIGYLDTIVLMSKCKLIMTDSGGLVEEATCPCIRKPVLILRLSTERPEAVKQGFARLVGTQKGSILRAVNETLAEPPKLPLKSPYGDGKASERIVKSIFSKEEILTPEYAVA